MNLKVFLWGMVVGLIVITVLLYIEVAPKI